MHNSGKKRPQLLMEDNPSVGLFNDKISYLNQTVRCEFDRFKSAPNVKNYFDLTNSYYLLFAKGAVSESNSVSNF
jgi:hypothetical protein